MKIYVVIGETGEYSDMTYSIVAAFSGEEAAQSFCLEQDAKYRLYKLWYDNYLENLRRLNHSYPPDRSEEAKKLAGPEPEYVAERHHYEEVDVVECNHD